MSDFVNRRTSYLCYNNSSLIRDGFIPNKIQRVWDSNSFTQNQLKILLEKNNPGEYYIGHKEVEVTDGVEEAIIKSVDETRKLLPASAIKIKIDFSKVLKSALSNLITGVSNRLTTVSASLAPVSLVTWPLGIGGLTYGTSEVVLHLLDSKMKINRPIIVDQELIDNGGIWECPDGYPLSVFGVIKECIVSEADNVWNPQAIEDQSFGLVFTSEQKKHIGQFDMGEDVLTGGPKKSISGATGQDGLFGTFGTPEVSFKEVALIDPSEENPSSTIGINDLSPDTFSGPCEDRIISKENNVRDFLIGDAYNRFLEIIQDDRTFRFRADGPRGATSFNQGVPSLITSNNLCKTDATSKKIKIDMNGLLVGDVLYITYEFATKRHLRQILYHYGVVGQGNTIGSIGFVGAVKSQVDAFNYSLQTWAVLKNPIISNYEDGYSDKNRYKMTFSEFDLAWGNIDLERSLKPGDTINTTESFIEYPLEVVEGWRISEAVSLNMKRHIKLFFADTRGIFSLRNGKSFTLLRSREQIENMGKTDAQKDMIKKWYYNFLEDLYTNYVYVQPDEIQYLRDSNGNYIVDDQGFYIEDTDFIKAWTGSKAEIDDKIDWSKPGSFLYDISEVCNSIFYDDEKVPYHKPFALALSKLREINASISNSDDKIRLGINQLDIFENKETLDIDYIEEYDISNALFSFLNVAYNKVVEPGVAYPLQPSLYASQPYNVDEDQQWRMYASTTLLNDTWGGTLPYTGDLESYWRMETPYLLGSFGQETRVYAEDIRGTARDNFSWIYIDTKPNIAGSISSCRNVENNSSIIVYNDHVLDSLSLHHFYSRIFEQAILDIKRNYEKTNVREAFSYNYNFERLGYNRLMGDSPTYSNGMPLLYEVPVMCSEGKDEIFWASKNIGAYFQGSSLHGLGYDDDGILTLFVPDDWKIKRLKLYYSFLPGEKSEPSESNAVSFYFEDTSTSISNIDFHQKGEPIEVSWSNEEVYYKEILFYYYHSGKIKFYGDFWDKIWIYEDKSKIIYNSESENSEGISIDDYKVLGEQSSIVVDNRGQYLIFYSNGNSGNIDLAISYDYGDTWDIHYSIIRLLTGETASMPQAVYNSDTEYLYLFYNLNDEYILCKPINTMFIWRADAFKEMLTPDSYEPGDYNYSSPAISEDDQITVEDIYWGDVSEEGQTLRRGASFFVLGNASENSFFEEQMSIVHRMEDGEGANPVNNAKMAPRFAYVTPSNYILSDNVLQDEINSMNRGYSGGAYAVHIDSNGIAKIFYVNNGKLCLKTSSDGFLWENEAQGLEIHRVFKDVKDEKGNYKYSDISDDISNVQVIKDDYGKDVISLLYFNNNMLFLRRFSASSFYSEESDERLRQVDIEEKVRIKMLDDIVEETTEDEDADIASIRERYYLSEDVDVDSFDTPIFLMGEIPENIWEVKRKEIDKGILGKDSEFIIRFPYSNDILLKEDNGELVQRFDAYLAVDYDTQPTAFIEKIGVARIFYRDSSGQLNGIVINGTDDIYPEVFSDLEQGSI